MLAILTLGTNKEEVNEMEAYANENLEWEYFGTCTELGDISKAKAQGREITRVMIYEYRCLEDDEAKALENLGVEVVSFSKLREKEVIKERRAREKTKEPVDVAGLEFY